MKPSEYFEQLRGPETNQEYIEQGNRRVVEILDNIGKYRRILEEGLFLEDENGGIELRTGKMGLPDSGKEIDGIEVFFKDPNGERVQLGLVVRSTSLDAASVFAYYRSRETRIDIVQADRYEKINIFDSRWEAVVGSLEAILEQLDNRIMPNNLKRFSFADFKVEDDE